METKSNFRLPLNVQPTHYKISLEPDLDNFTFSGIETIAVNIFEATDCVVLNATELKIHNAKIVDSSGESYSTVGITYDEKLERVSLIFGQIMSSGQYSIQLEFSGYLNDQLR